MTESDDNLPPPAPRPWYAAIGVEKLGPMALTGSVSNEEGESQTTTLQPSGTGASKSTISEKDFVQNRSMTTLTAGLSFKRMFSTLASLKRRGRTNPLTGCVVVP